MTRIADALALAEETLAMLELEGTRLTPVVLRCLRLARLLGYAEAEKWFLLELRGYRAGVLGHGNWATYASWSGREASKTEDDQQRYWVAPIEAVEAQLEIAREELRALQMPTYVPEPTSGVRTDYWEEKTATERIFQSIKLERGMKADEIRRWTHIVASLRGAIQQWLSQTVVELRYGAIVDTAFQRAKERFDAFLTTKAPEAARALAAAFARAGSSEPEEWSQGLTSCRRALKALANTLYPPTDEKPSGHELTEENYVNRLIQFASDNLTSDSQRNLVVANISSVTERAEALYKLSSKGVHADVEERDVELTVVHTYLLAGELLGLAPEKPDASPEPAAPAIHDQAAASDSVSSGEVDIDLPSSENSAT